MSEPRYIPVPFSANGDGPRNMLVRVISQHADDDPMRRALYKANNFFDRCRKLKEAPPAEQDAKKIVAYLELVSDLELARDAAVRELFAAVLKDKHNGDDIGKVLKICSIKVYMDIFYAAQGLEPVPDELPTSLLGQPEPVTIPSAS